MEFSVILCTYNPDLSRLNRVIQAIKSQNFTRQWEVLLVDNNSERPLCESELIKQNAWIRCLSEKRQGLAQARITGFSAANGNTLVFFDDDNIPAPDYLSQLAQVMAEDNSVGAWGPGIIELEYEREPPRWIDKHFGEMYQRKNIPQVTKGRVRGWPSYYPAGSGLAVKRAVMETYAEKFEQGELTSTGRKGKTLSSGEDAQIVWTAIKLGYEVGSTPRLKLVHVIPASRLSLDYLVRLQYSLAYSYCQSMAEIFPEQKTALKPLSTFGHLKLAVNTFKKSKFKPLLFARMLSISAAWFRAVHDWSKS